MTRLNAVRVGGREIEDRVYELLRELRTPLEIADELGLGPVEGCELVFRVIDERGTPHGAAVRRGLEQLAEIRI